jgi:hypothetical protein
MSILASFAPRDVAVGVAPGAAVIEGKQADCMLQKQ